MFRRNSLAAPIHTIDKIKHTEKMYELPKFNTSLCRLSHVGSVHLDIGNNMLIGKSDPGSQITPKLCLVHEFGSMSTASTTCRTSLSPMTSFYRSSASLYSKCSKSTETNSGSSLNSTTSEMGLNKLGKLWKIFIELCCFPKCCYRRILVNVQPIPRTTLKRVPSRVSHIPY